ncbi:hypothetical protein HY500_02445 [Candidatus Woesearchaeota archaeon]|nr:hypothetical protein [Candidatus Woesearchaeota archaeon]
MELTDSLKEFGLSEKESKTYLTLLELGESTATDISIKSKLPRTLVYDLLEKLISLGLVSYTVKNNKKYFLASDPKELIRILKEKEEKIQEILPELESIQKIRGSKRPKVEIYEGKEGMKTMMNNILNSKIKEFLAYGSSRSSYEIIPAFMEHWHKKRIKEKVVMKVIYNDTKEAREKVKKFKSSLRLVYYKFMPIQLESPTAILIYSNKVILQSWTKEPFAVMIKNEQTAENQKKYFGELWKIAKK